MSRVGSFILEVVARYDINGQEYQLVDDVTNEKTYSHEVPMLKSLKHFADLCEVVEELINADSIYYINKHYIKAIATEIFEGDYPKEKAYNVLYQCYLNH